MLVYDFATQQKLLFHQSLHCTVTTWWLDSLKHPLSVAKNLKSPKSRQILSAVAVNNLKVAWFFIKLKCAQLSHFGRFYVAN